MRMGFMAARVAAAGVPAVLSGVLGALVLLGSGVTVAAQDIRVGDITAHVFLERSGRLSDDLLTQRQAKFADLPRGEGPYGEPANTVIFVVTLQGAKNTQPKFAAAIVNITVRNRLGQVRTERRALEGFVFGEDGTLKRPIVLENATCSGLQVEVKTQRFTRNAKVDFTCTEPKAAEGQPEQPRTVRR